METDRNIQKDMKESNLFDFSNFTNEDYYDENNIFVPGMFLIHYLLYIISNMMFPQKLKKTDKI